MPSYVTLRGSLSRYLRIVQLEWGLAPKHLHHNLEFSLLAVDLLDFTSETIERTIVDYSGLYDSLAGPTTLMLSNTGNAPAKLIKSFRQKKEKLPALKAAFVEETTYVGPEQLEALATIKSKNELIADVVALLQSPAKNVISALQSGGGKLHGILETLSNKEN